MILFFITFLSVFLLGFQQQNVTHEKYKLAMITSFIIAFSQFTVYREAVSASGYEWIWMGLGGSFGIVTSMILHKKMRKRDERRNN